MPASPQRRSKIVTNTKMPSHICETQLTNQEKADLIAYLKIIWSGKITILLITIISFLIAIGYTNLIPNIYLNHSVIC